ncbi:MAG TPA: DUF6491 family protein [Steroidobacteraceae bacterium]|nr:DUF6491 family protein [Steroidobacteraceae bacterium]
MSIRPCRAWLAAGIGAIVLMGCSGIPRRSDNETLQRYQAYAGEPVDRITYLGRYDGWVALGRYDLVVWTTLNDAYLITVLPPCENLPFANRIGLTSTAGQVSARFDNVLVRGWKCRIKEIRPVDYKRLRQDMRQDMREKDQKKAQDEAAGAH